MRQSVARQQLGSSNSRRSAAAHTVVQGNHLRHVGHGNALTAEPGPAGTQPQSQNQQEQVGAQMRLGARADIKAVQKGRNHRHQHTAAGNDNARAGSNRAGHTLEAVQEQKGCDKVGRVNQKSTEHGLLTPCLRRALCWSA